MKYLEDVYFTNLNAVYNFGGYFSIDKTEEWKFGEHAFEQCKFYFIVEGGCTITIDGKEYHGKAGDWFFIPSKTLHSYANDKSGRFSKYWMHFNLYPDEGVLTGLGVKHVVKVEPNSQARKLFEKFFKIYKSDALVDKLVVKSILLELIAEYLKKARPEGISVKSRADERMDKLLRYINENLDKALTNEILAEKYFTHPNHFIRAFKEQVGVTPAKYINSRRMERAKLLLESTDLTVSEITERIGLKDSAHFSRLFKEHYNMPPTTYKKYFLSKLIV